MSTRVLGQYDLLIIEDEDPEDQDLVYYVGPNVLALEKRFGFPPREFRLWLALHEVTHRAQFTGVPWLRAALPRRSSTRRSTPSTPTPSGSSTPPPGSSTTCGRATTRSTRAASPPCWPAPTSASCFGRIGGMMSLLEGHGDVTMDRAGEGHVPSAARFSRALRERRRQGGSTAKVLQKVMGIDAKMKQYAQGESFIAYVERHGGTGAARRRLAGPASGCPRWPRSGPRRSGSTGSRLSEELVGLSTPLADAIR